ncbi:MAG: RIO1 family regulatory kinase/ATPase domain-containing protein [Anaerolineae bacterium]
MTKHSLETQTEYYETIYDPIAFSTSELRPPKPNRPHKPKQAIAARSGEPDLDTSTEEGFTTTYHPARYEKGFLLQSLQSFYEEALISDVLAKVRGGKEASVYRCLANPVTGLEYAAVKVYRPRMFRSLRNDAVYREGREVIDNRGVAFKKSDHRVMCALGKKTAFGLQIAQTSWLAYEYITMRRLFQAGAQVPRPLASNDHAILMSYCGDANLAAPTLNEVDLEPDEARRLFALVLHNIELFLQQDLIHGDLSAYNILYWQGEITLIDFPQVTSCHGNRNAYAILLRDITRVCDYFAQYDVVDDAETICRTLWQRYMQRDPIYELADTSRNWEEA